jgi:hypothetical protein
MGLLGYNSSVSQAASVPGVVSSFRRNLTWKVTLALRKLRHEDLEFQASLMIMVVVVMVVAAMVVVVVVVVMMVETTMTAELTKP